MRLGSSFKKVADGFRSRFGQSAAVKRIAALVEDGSSESFHQLIALWTEADGPRRELVAAALSSFGNAELWDGVWSEWAASANPELEALLKRLKIEAQCDELRDRSMLKLDREGEMPTNREFAGGIMAYRDDPDLDVRRAASRYWHRLESVNPDAYVYCCLLAGTFKKIGVSEDVVDRVLKFQADPDLRARAEGYRRSLPRKEAIYWDLRSRLFGKIRLDPESREILCLFAAGADEELAVLARQALEALKSDSPTHYLWAMLKLGEAPAGTLSNVRTVAELVGDADADVSVAAKAWVRALPDSPRENDCLYDAWLSTDDRDSLSWLTGSCRRSSVPANQLLAALLCGGVPSQFPDLEPLAKRLAAAWSRATQNQRSALLEMVETCRDTQLIAAYEEAFGGRRDFDLALYVRALISIDDDDKLFELLPYLTFAQGLELLHRWETNDWLPHRKDDRAFVESLRRRFVSLSVGDDQPAVSEVDWWGRYEDAMRRTGVAVEPDRVIWVNMAAGAAPELLEAPLSGDPEEYGDYVETNAHLAKYATPLAVRLASLISLLILFRERYATAITVYEVAP